MIYTYMTHCTCGKYSCIVGTANIQCPLCERILIAENTSQKEVNKNKPALWIRLLQRLSSPQDIGLGATVKRIADKVGGERFKVWSKRIGLPCGCTEREIKWNRLYPNPNYKTPKI